MEWVNIPNTNVSTNGNIGAVIFAIGLLAFATINKK